MAQPVKWLQQSFLIKCKRMIEDAVTSFGVSLDEADTPEFIVDAECEQLRATLRANVLLLAEDAPLLQRPTPLAYAECLMITRLGLLNAAVNANVDFCDCGFRSIIRRDLYTLFYNLDTRGWSKQMKDSVEVYLYLFSEHRYGVDEYGVPIITTVEEMEEVRLDLMD